VWTQPKGQSFTDKKSELGGLLNVKTSYVINEILPYLEIEIKSKGWVMGNVFLEDNLSARLGFSLIVD